MENYKIDENFAFNLKYVCSNLETLQANRSVLDFTWHVRSHLNIP